MATKPCYFIFMIYLTLLRLFRCTRALVRHWTPTILIVENGKSLLQTKLCPHYL
jgi:hypothetical protein